MSHAKTLLRTTAALCATALAACVAPPPDQPPPPPAEAAAALLGPAELDQLTAPVALYDDQLLADVLTASTYPGEVVQALRWTQLPANTALQGTALTTALAGQDWDPSVKSLVPFPAVLTTMDSHLAWTQHLGEAFLAQPADVMASVQRLRARAQAAGTLRTTKQEVVTQSGAYVTIAPPASQVIYVPSYNPWCAYGAWGDAGDGRYYYGPNAGGCGGAADEIFWGPGLYQPFDYWGWGYFDWGGGALLIDGGRWGRFGGWNHGWYGDHGDHGGRGGNVWQHDAGHRGGVPYSTPANAARFGGAQGYHGYSGRNGEPGNIGRGTAPAYESLGSGHGAWAESSRGQASRGFGGGGFHGGGGGFGGGGGGSHGGGGHR